MLFGAKKNGVLSDITPFHEDQKHHPLKIGNSILFAVDDNAKLLITERTIYPLPSRFYSLSKDKNMVSYVQKLEQNEKKYYERLLLEENYS